MKLVSTPDAAAAAVTAAATAKLKNAPFTKRCTVAGHAHLDKEWPQLPNVPDDWGADPTVQIVSRGMGKGSMNQQNKSSGAGASSLADGGKGQQPSTSRVDQWGWLQSRVNEGGRTGEERPPSGRPAPAATQRSKKLLVVGQSSNAPMHAAKQLNLPKSVYCVRNIDAGHTAEQL